jgi:hypothetical protein
LETLPVFLVTLKKNAKSRLNYTELKLTLHNDITAKILAMSGSTASNPLDVCGVEVATCTGNAPKSEYRIYVVLLQLRPSRRRETSSGVIPRMQPREKRTAKEKSKTSSQGTLWEDVLP